MGQGREQRSQNRLFAPRGRQTYHGLAKMKPGACRRGTLEGINFKIQRASIQGILCRIFLGISDSSKCSKASDVTIDESMYVLILPRTNSTPRNEIDINVHKDIARVSRTRSCHFVVGSYWLFDMLLSSFSPAGMSTDIPNGDNSI
jgi:hypothetical protein